jgi:RES domain-containing protein
MLEKLVHTGRQIPKHQVCVTFELPDELAITRIDLGAANGCGAGDQRVSRKIGHDWLDAAATGILPVRGVVFGVEQNALLNPGHPDYIRVRVASVEPVRWDERMFF